MLWSRADRATTCNTDVAASTEPRAAAAAAVAVSVADETAAACRDARV